MLNELAKDIHEMAADHGFWPDGKERNVSEVLMLIVSEAVEAMEEHRAGRGVNETLYEDPNVHGLWSTAKSERFRKPVGVPSELADVVIRTLDACAGWGIDIEAVIAEKMAYNTTRGNKHGKSY